jgi:acyl-CoA synthetase (NDP forming)
MKSRDGKDIWAFFEPRSVAIFGSLKDGTGLGYGAIKNMLDFGFQGKLYPVNPSGGDVLGLKAYSSIDELFGSIDLAIVITPPQTVPAIIEQCAQKGIKAAVIVSENFAEAGDGGTQLQQQLVDITNRTGIRIIGPNTVGVLNLTNGLVTIPYMIGYKDIRKGGIAYCSQTGIAAAQCQPLGDRAYPISKMCDFGNKCDVNEIDLLNYLSDDPDTQVVVMHLEDVKDGRSFIDAARSIASHKPLFILKPGRTEAGARASASHTGSLAVSDRIYDSAMKQVGAIRVNTWQEYWDIPKVFAYQPLPRGNRIAIVSHSGGAGVVATDSAVEAGLVMANFSDVTLAKLAGLSARLARNPIDLGPALSLADAPFSLQEEIIAMVLDDANVDCATIVLYGGVMSPVRLVVEMFYRLKRRISKPVTIWFYGTQLSLLEEMSRQLEERGFPTYTDLETAVRALGALSSYAKFRESLQR